MNWTTRKSRKALSTILLYGKRYRSWLIRGGLATIGVVLFRLAMPWPLRGVIELVLPDTNSQQKLISYIPQWGDPTIWFGISFVLIALGLGFSELRQRILMKTYSSYVVRDMRSAALRSVVQTKSSQSRQAAGDVIARIVGDSARIKAQLSSFLIHATQNGLLFLGVSLVVFSLSPKLGFVYLLSGIAAIGISYGFSFRVAESTALQRKREGNYAVMIQNSLEYGGLHTGAEDVNVVSTEKDLRTSRLIAKSTLILHVVLALFTAVALWVAVGDVKSGELKAGELFLFIAYVLTVHRRLVQVGRQLAGGGKMLANVRRIDVLIGDPREASAVSTIEQIHSEIRLQGIRLDSSRTKDGKPRRLKTMDLKIQAGTRVAVIGEPGSGKSSLLRVLAGMEPPDRGKCFWDGEEISNGNILLSCIGYLPQSTVFQPARGWRILGLESPDDLNPEQTKTLRKIGGWKLFRTLPKGLEEKVGSWSMTQNEARALNLFRILLGNTEVLILDAPLEGLNKENKIARLKEIISHANGRTLVMGMVEPMKMKYFDRVVVLKNGRIEFEGPIQSWDTWKEEKNPQEDVLAINSSQPACLEVEEV
jgi:ABC-type multidrug transport system fused ATPase/permease subunit